MNEKGPAYEELEKKLADAEALIARMQGEVETIISERDAALLDTGELQEAYIESEQNFRNSMDACPLGIRIVTEDGNLLYANQAILDICGLNSIEELKTLLREQLYTPQSYAERQERIEKRQRGEFVPPEYEISIRRPDGETRNLQVLRKEVIWGGERQFLSMYQDITERKRVEEALQESESKFRNLFEHTLDAVFLVDTHTGIIFDVNLAACGLLDMPKEKIVGRHHSQIHPPDMVDKYKQLFREHVEKGVSYNEDLIVQRADGSLVPVDISASVIKLAGKRVIQGVFRDITERKRAEERINNLNLTLRSIRHVNQLITREKNRDKLIKGICHNLVESRSFNSTWIALFDESRKLIAWAENGLRNNFSSLLEPLKQGNLPRCVQKAMRQKPVVITEDPHSMCTGCPLQPDNTGIGSMTVRLEYEGDIYGVLCASLPESLLSDKDEVTLFKEVAMDISFALYNIDLEVENEFLEQEHLRTAKLESIGTLAGGIAHDFNNLLTGIMGNIGLARTYIKPTDKSVAMLDEAEKAAVGARDLTQQLLTFARGGKPVKKLINIARLTKKAATFALRGSNVRLELSLPDDLWSVEADEGQISQVISNLVINADEAMPAGGILKIEASNLVLKRAGALPLSRGNYVRIDVKDTGVGISQEHLQRIFEPYFTTKQKGSGLGLPTAYSIVRNHGGYILAESTLNKGSTFYVYLPASKKTEKAEKKTAGESFGRAGGRVLVMDDEEIIRKMLKNMLNLAGYEAELTGDGAEAVEKYAQALEAGKPFDAVIMDLTIPGGMGGKEAIKKLLEIDPDAKVIVSSGYATDPIMSEYKKYGFSAVIAKPYNVKQLEETMRSISKRKKK